MHLAEVDFRSVGMHLAEVDFQNVGFAEVDFQSEADFQNVGIRFAVLVYWIPQFWKQISGHSQALETYWMSNWTRSWRQSSGHSLQ
mmetsp:Transcript_88747/g.170100  ORF Transcript_88747/g.170100 Transcript_88747/m.170100 type:complete len:86 (+) Transcript_88747:331-588(+)